VAEQYTRSQVERILGVSKRQLNYWEKLRLVRPRARWGERFYTFCDLISLRTIQRVTENRIPARRLWRALRSLQAQTGSSLPLHKLRAMASGRELVLIPPGPQSRPIAPLTGQFVMAFEHPLPAGKVRPMASFDAEEWFETGVALESDSESLPEAAQAYRRAIQSAPDWPEAWMRLGGALYQLNRLPEAARAFRSALKLEPENAGVHLSLGCVLYGMGCINAAIRHLYRAVRLDPRFALAHLNLALAYETRGNQEAARQHWSTYLRFEPEGPWADYARLQLGHCSDSVSSPKTIPCHKTE
jgi:tetratricopeptide (TPR) repeat protein